MEMNSILTSIASFKMQTYRVTSYFLVTSLFFNKFVKPGLVVGESGLGKYTKNSELELPSVFQQDLEQGDFLVSQNSQVNNDPNHQELIEPKFQLLKECPC